MIHDDYVIDYVIMKRTVFWGVQGVFSHFCVGGSTHDHENSIKMIGRGFCTVWIMNLKKSRKRPKKSQSYHWKMSGGWKRMNIILTFQFGSIHRSFYEVNRLHWLMKRFQEQVFPVRILIWISEHMLFLVLNSFSTDYRNKKNHKYSVF